MVVEKVFGLTATGIPLSERFAVLQAAGRPQPVMQRRRAGSMPPANLKMRNKMLLDQLALRSKIQAALAAKRRAQFRQRIGQLRGTAGGGGGSGGLRRWGSEGSLFSVAPVRNSFNNSGLNGRLGRAESVGRTGRAGSVGRIGAYGNLSGSFGNLSQLSGHGGVWRRPNNPQRIRQRGRGRGRGRGQFVNAFQRNGVPRQPMRGVGRGRARGAMRGARGRGGAQRTQQQQKPIPTKEELDKQIDQYMACTKSALDKELDAYMENADMDTF